MTFDRRASRPAPPPFLSFGFRPMFLGAGLWAALAIVLWIAVLLTGRTPPSRFDPLNWHIHAMLFGFVPAAIAGFLLTAVATWTARPPIRGTLLGCLALLWLAGRLACLWSARLPLWLASSVDVSFCAVVSAVTAREVIVARNWRNLAIPLPLLMLAAGNALMYAEAAGAAISGGLGWRVGLAGIIILISIIGGRIIPAFTQNWLSRQARSPAALPRSRPLDVGALATLQAGLLGWALWPSVRPIGALLLVSAALSTARWLRWRGISTFAEPLLAVLHLGYAWVIGGVALLGASLLSSRIPLPAAIHALTVGAIGTMVLAVMTRVSLGHTGRVLHAGRITTLIYGLVMLAAALRVAAALTMRAYLALILTAAALWVAAFVLFAAEYAPILVSPRADQRHSGEPARSDKPLGRDTSS